MKKMNKTRGIVYAILSLVIIACLGGIVLFGLPNWKCNHICIKDKVILDEI